MKGIRWFQRFMITLLIGLNSFVFLSMKDVSIGDNLLYTISFVGVVLVFLTIVSFIDRSKKKKSINNSL